MTSRDAMLARIRDAIGPEPIAVEVPRDYLHHGELAPGSDAAVHLLTDRLVDYRADVTECAPDDVADAVLRAVATSTSVVVPEGMPAGLVERLGAGDRRVELDHPARPLTAAELDGIDAVVTLAALAVAVNGVIMLDAGSGQGRRIISLVPDLHVVILARSQVVETMPEALAQLDPTRPITMIAGPSATSDIELSRVEGVHGPRTLRVVIVDDARS